MYAASRARGGRENPRAARVIGPCHSPRERLNGDMKCSDWNSVHRSVETVGSDQNHDLPIMHGVATSLSRGIRSGNRRPSPTQG